MTLLLGIDLSTTGAKALLIDPEGNQQRHHAIKSLNTFSTLV
jgi:sugar (pentulose or hexulose) kinase